MSQMHWALNLIGLPYKLGASGPDEFDCWGLVRWVFENVHGIQMPVIQVGQTDPSTPANLAAIRQAALVSGWRPTPLGSIAIENDILLMTGLEGRHVGVMVAANGGLFFLHCIDRVGVCLQPLQELRRAGFRDFTSWRREK